MSNLWIKGCWWRVRDKPRLAWMDGVKPALGCRGMKVKAEEECAEDMKEWRAQVHIEMIGIKAAIFAWFMCSFGSISRALVAYFMEMSRCRYMLRLM